MTRKKKADKQSKSSQDKSYLADHLKPWQWQKGQSGNPAGRSPDPLSFTSVHKRGFAELIPERIQRDLAPAVYHPNKGESIPEEWMREWMKLKITWYEAIMIRNRAKIMSVSGDRIMMFTWEMLDGKAVQKIAGAEGGALRIEVEQQALRKGMTTEELRRYRSKEMTRGEYEAIVARIVQDEENK